MCVCVCVCVACVCVGRGGGRTSALIKLFTFIGWSSQFMYATSDRKLDSGEAYARCHWEQHYHRSGNFRAFNFRRLTVLQ